MFSIIQDSVDTNALIIRHERTGNYNITKTLIQYNLIHGTNKQIADWNKTQSGERLKARMLEKSGKDVIFVLDANTPNEYKGTYVHQSLYRAILMWLDIEYAISIFDILQKHQEENEIKLKSENSDFKKTISLLFEKIDNIETDVKESKEIAKNAEFNLKFMTNKMNTKLDKVVGMLSEKSIASTMNPANPALHHNFVVMGYQFTDVNTGHTGWELSLIAGQDMNVKKAIRKKFADEEHAWIIVIQMHYNANPVDLRNNIKDYIHNRFITEYVSEVNLKRVEEMDISNAELKEEIRVYMENKLEDDPIRLYENEKIKEIIKLKAKDIPIKCRCTKAKYIDNEYISYDEFLGAIRSVNVKTQASPYQSEDSDNAKEA